MLRDLADIQLTQGCEQCPVHVPHAHLVLPEEGRGERGKHQRDTHDQENGEDP